MKLPPSLQGVLGVFGGTFDPIHNGHLRAAYELKRRLGLERIHFVPAGQPPHRPEPLAPIGLRLQMLEAALADEPGCVVDRREIERAGPSYSIDTAQSFRSEYPTHALCLMLGMDAFLDLPKWHRWTELLDTVNLIVARRPGTTLPRSGDLGSLLTRRRVLPDSSLSWEPAGQIIVQNVTQLEIASTDLRESIKAGIKPKYLVPPAVGGIIEASGCYAREDGSIES
ncbi:MAG: nicotinate-nucleotide adenylyltransferase [Gammaproteobacteria bacterium]|jgi:nicotinate-nucleotide adenylyltransferase